MINLSIDKLPTGSHAMADAKINSFQSDRPLNVPGTQCIYNPASDTGFDMLVCNTADLRGKCSNLQDLQRVNIGGYWNWYTPGTASMKRTGN